MCRDPSRLSRSLQRGYRKASFEAGIARLPQLARAGSARGRQRPSHSRAPLAPERWCARPRDDGYLLDARECRVAELGVLRRALRHRGLMAACQSLSELEPESRARHTHPNCPCRHADPRRRSDRTSVTAAPPSHGATATACAKPARTLAHRMERRQQRVHGRSSSAAQRKKLDAGPAALSSESSGCISHLSRGELGQSRGRSVARLRQKKQPGQ